MVASGGVGLGRRRTPECRPIINEIAGNVAGYWFAFLRERLCACLGTRSARWSILPSGRLAKVENLYAMKKARSLSRLCRKTGLRRLPEFFASLGGLPSASGGGALPGLVISYNRINFIVVSPLLLLFGVCGVLLF